MRTEDCGLLDICENYGTCFKACYADEEGENDDITGLFPLSNLPIGRCSIGERKQILILDAIFKKISE